MVVSHIEAHRFMI